MEGQDSSSSSSAHERRISDYLIALGQNPDELRAFAHNPERAMTQWGLDEYQRSLIMSGNLAKIQQEIQAEGGGDTALAFFAWPHPPFPHIVWG